MSIFPAFSSTISSLLNPSALATNFLTDFWLARSSCQTSTVPIHFVVSSMDFFAIWPFFRFRTTKIVFSALSRTKCYESPRRRTQLEPVTMMIYPVDSSAGYERVAKFWIKNQSIGNGMLWFAFAGPILDKGGNIWDSRKEILYTGWKHYESVTCFLP